MVGVREEREQVEICCFVFVCFQGFIVWDGCWFGVGSGFLSLLLGFFVLLFFLLIGYDFLNLCGQFVFQICCYVVVLGVGFDFGQREFVYLFVFRDLFVWWALVSVYGIGGWFGGFGFFLGVWSFSIQRGVELIFFLW